MSFTPGDGTIAAYKQNCDLKLYIHNNGSLLSLREITKGKYHEPSTLRWYTDSDVRPVIYQSPSPWPAFIKEGQLPDPDPKDKQGDNKMLYQLSNNTINAVNVDDIRMVVAFENLKIKIAFKSHGVSDPCVYTYTKQSIRDHDLKELIKLSNTKENKMSNDGASQSHENFFKSLMGDGKDFIKENKSVIYTVAMIFLVDHFVFEGAFREKLKSLVDAMIGKVEKSIKGK